MKPLAPVRSEYQRTGGVEVVAGIGFGAVAGVTGRPGNVVPAVLIVAVTFGGLMYLLYRRYLADAIGAARSAPISHAETRRMTWTRIGRTTGLIVVVLIVFALLFRDAAVIGGILLGNGLMFLGLSGRVARWERANGARVYREPHWRWGLRGDTGSWRSRGAFEPTDFYIDTPERSGN